MPIAGRLERLRAWLPQALLGFALLAGMGRGIDQGLDDEAEWNHYECLVRQPLAESSGPDEPIFGYLPGCKALLAPFVHTEPVGTVVFALLNALACLAISQLVQRHFGRGGSTRDELWFSLCASVPMWFALQNNQLVAPAVLLTLLAFRRMASGGDLGAGALFALAVLLKTLPLPILLFPLVAGRWRVLVSALGCLAVLSLGLAVLTDGWSEGLASHLRWPAQVSAQNPVRALDTGLAPLSFPSNQSPAAELVRLALAWDAPALVWIQPVLVLASLALLAALSLFAASRKDAFWPLVAGWLAWVAFAAPFGRYYYLLFLVPALYVVGLRALDHAGSRRRACAWALTALCLSLLVARSHNPLYALTSCAVLLAYLIHLARTLREANPTAAAGG